MRNKFLKKTISFSIVPEENHWLIEIYGKQTWRIVCRNVLTKKVDLQFHDISKLQGEKRVFSPLPTERILSLYNITEMDKIQNDERDRIEIVCDDVYIEDDERKAVCRIFESIVFGDWRIHNPEKANQFSQKDIDFLKDIEKRSADKEPEFWISQGELDRLAELFEKTED